MTLPFILFFQSIQAILFENGLGYIWKNPNLLSGSLNRAGKCLQERLQDQYVQTWFERQNLMPFGSKLSMLKSSYDCSNYLNLIYNHDIRKIFTKLRIGYNILNDSIGRFKNLNRGSSKFCNNCLTKIEIVEHFLFKCSSYQDIRNKHSVLFNKYLNLYSSTDQKLNFILNISETNRSRSNNDFIWKPISAKTRYILQWMKCVSREKRCIFQVQRCIFQLVRCIIPIWRPSDISGGRQLENEMYISSGKMYILNGEMFSPVEIYIFSLKIYISFCKWRPPDISGGRHLESEMYISSGKMHISTGEMYYSYLAAARYIIWRPPLRE